jgi:hypothetical protein
MRVDILNVRQPSRVTVGRAGRSLIGDASLGIMADQILLTGNWYAARSLDRGATWSPLDPYSYLEPGPPTPFCCDQSVFYDARHDLMVWLLQYQRSTRDNTLRIAVKRGATLDDDDWNWWDLQPSTVNADWTKEWFDYNHAATTETHLFVGSNVFGLAGKRVFRSVALRIPFASIESALETGTPLNIDYLERSDSGTLRCVVGATDTMYIAGQFDTESIRVFTWPDADLRPTSEDIAVSRWTDSSYSAPGPDGFNWLGRCDDRITTGWVSNGKIGLMWTANRLGAERPYPHIRVAIIDAATGGLAPSRTSGVLILGMRTQMLHRMRMAWSA